jgi:hypothetical protein
MFIPEINVPYARVNIIYYPKFNLDTWREERTPECNNGIFCYDYLIGKKGEEKNVATVLSIFENEPKRTLYFNPPRGYGNHIPRDYAWIHPLIRPKLAF